MIRESAVFCKGSSDTTPPIVTCPSNIIQAVEVGTPFAEINVPQPTATDDSGTVFFVGSTLPGGNLFPIGTTSVTYSYRDGANNQASCTVLVTVTGGKKIISRAYFDGKYILFEPGIQCMIVWVNVSNLIISSCDHSYASCS